MRTWTLKEEVVLVYYLTRNITYVSIIELIAVKCGTEVRRPRHVSDKVAKLLKFGVLERPLQHVCRRNRDQHWDIKRADRWILHVMRKAELDNLLDFSGYVAAVIDESNDLGRFLDIMHMNDAGQAYWPSRFNAYYKLPMLPPMQSPHRLETLYQIENTGMQFVDDGRQALWPSQSSQPHEMQLYQSVYDLDRLHQRQFNQQYELPELSPLSQYHLDNLDNLDNLDQ